MRSPARLLFHTPGRRGLGHVMRSANLARAVLERDSSAAVLLAIQRHSAAPVVPADIPHVAMDGGAHDVARLVDDFAPSLMVFDTVLPRHQVPDTVPQAFVWRRCVPERQRAMLADARLRRMRTIIVPHAEEEGPYDLPPSIARRTVYVGAIVRQSTAARRTRIRRRYGLNDEDVVVTSTLGGGGFVESAGWLLEALSAAHEAMLERVPGLRHVLVLGPLSAQTRPRPRRNLTVVDVEPDLVDLFAVSDLVVAEAGYNTVHELRAVGVPAVLVPGERALDDQMSRARTLADRGLVRVASREAIPDVVRTIADLAADSEARAAMRERLRADPFVPGNARAADALLEAIE